MGQLQTVDGLTHKQLKRKLGRPTKYTQAILAKTIEYLSTYKDKGELIPTRAGLALFLELDRETVTTWANDKEKPEFSRLIHALDAGQEVDALSGGLKGTYNPKIAALVLSKHGYTEGSQAATGVSITVNVDRSCNEVSIDGEVVND